MGRCFACGRQVLPHMRASSRSQRQEWGTQDWALRGLGVKPPYQVAGRTPVRTRQLTSQAWERVLVVHAVCFRAPRSGAPPPSDARGRTDDRSLAPHRRGLSRRSRAAPRGHRTPDPRVRRSQRCRQLGPAQTAHPTELGLLRPAHEGRREALPAPFRTAPHRDGRPAGRGRRSAYGRHPRHVSSRVRRRAPRPARSRDAVSSCGSRRSRRASPTGTAQGSPLLRLLRVSSATSTARPAVRLPRTSGAIRAKARRISAAQARPGDLVFVQRHGRVSHVAIYAGNGRWWEASNASRPVGKNKAWTRSVSYGRV